MPINEYGFYLGKRDFRRILAISYGWPLCDVPAGCICTKEFTPAHVMSCATGGFSTIRHHEVRNPMADLISDVCSDVAGEPLLADRGRKVNCW